MTLREQIEAIAPVCWRREWIGDVSDLGAFVHADSVDELDGQGPWEPLYSAADVAVLREDALKVEEAEARISVLQTEIAELHRYMNAEIDRTNSAARERDDKNDAYIGLKGATDALLRDADRRIAALTGKLNAVAAELGHPKDAWDIAGCDVLAHYVRDLAANYGRQAERVHALEKMAAGFCEAHDAADGNCPCCVAAHERDLRDAAERERDGMREAAQSLVSWHNMTYAEKKAACGGDGRLIEHEEHDRIEALSDALSPAEPAAEIVHSAPASVGSVPKMEDRPVVSSLARERAAQAWRQPETSGIEMDHRLAEAFAAILDGVWTQPWLGNATTAQLLDELRARCEMNGTLHYKTTDPETHDTSPRTAAPPAEDAPSLPTERRVASRALWGTLERRMADGYVRVPRVTLLAAINYIRHVGSNATERGEPHPQQLLLDSLLASAPQESKPISFDEYAAARVAATIVPPEGGKS